MSEQYGGRKKEHHLRDLERIKELRLLDDIFMKVVLRDNLEGVQDIIRIVLRRDDLKVIKVETQDELSNLVGHGVRLDVLAEDSEGRFYNIEIQRSDKGAGERRARFNLGALDWHKFPADEDYKNLAEAWVIFITENDVFGENLPLYTINRFVEETGKMFNDGGHILYVNGAYVGEDAIGRLAADFRAKNPDEMNFPSLANRVRQFKQTEGGVKSMCRIMEEVWTEGREDGREEGRAEGRAENRENVIDALLLYNSEEALLHGEQFQGLHITQEEIDAARQRKSA